MNSTCFVTPQLCICMTKASSSFNQFWLTPLIPLTHSPANTGVDTWDTSPGARGSWGNPDSTVLGIFCTSATYSFVHVTLLSLLSATEPSLSCQRLWQYCCQNNDDENLLLQIGKLCLPRHLHLLVKHLKPKTNNMYFRIYCDNVHVNFLLFFLFGRNK